MHWFSSLPSLLAPSPARWRASLRLTLLCVLGTAIVMAFHIPNGEFLVVFFFAVSQPDAWASLRKARLRGIGTLLGGAMAILVILSCGDKPWAMFVLQGLLFSLTLFLSRTTTIPYAFILAMFTYVIATPVATIDPEVSLQTVLWRILLTFAGAVLGTFAQLVLWPENPEQLLLRKLANRLRALGASLDWIAAPSQAAGASGQPMGLVEREVLASTLNQMDLLASAEAGSPRLRGFRAEQMDLITSVECLLIAGLRLQRLVLGRQFQSALKEATRASLGRISAKLVEIAAALEKGRTVPPDSAPVLAAAPDDVPHPDSVPLHGVLNELARGVGRLLQAMVFLADGKRENVLKLSASHNIHEPIADQGIFTPSCRLDNLEAIKFGLKGALAASLCYVFYQALNWPGLSTSVVTTLIVAQSSFGAGVQKSLLRLAGAVLGGLMACLVVVVAMPNMDTLAPFLLSSGVMFFVASWITTGSPSISYIGLQVGLVLSLVLLNHTGPTIDLAFAGDRVLGVLLGISVMGFVDLSLWPNFAGAGLRRKLVEALHALAELPRCLERCDWAKGPEIILTAQRELGAALTLHREWQLEFGEPKSAEDDQRQTLLTVIDALARIFIGLRALLRSRMDLERARAPSPCQPQLKRLDELLADTLQTMARAETTPRTAPLAVYDTLMHEVAEDLKTARKVSDPPGALAARYEELLPFYHDVWQTLQNSPLQPSEAGALQDFGLRQSPAAVGADHHQQPLV